jgi:hypothetical protein
MDAEIISVVCGLRDDEDLSIKMAAGDFVMYGYRMHSLVQYALRVPQQLGTVVFFRAVSTK